MKAAIYARVSTANNEHTLRVVPLPQGGAITDPHSARQPRPGPSQPEMSTKQSNARRKHVYFTRSS